MAAYAALASLLNNIEQMMNPPRLSTSLDNEQIQLLVEKTSFLLEFIEGYKHGGSSKEAEDVERQITHAAHAAEDVIESHIVDQIQGESSVRISYLINMFLLKCMGCHDEASDIPKYTTLDLQQIIEDMDTIMETVKETRRGSRDEQPLPTHSSRGVSALMETGETSGTRMVGLDDELMQLLDKLTGHQSNRQIISIVGMGGMGKTTLAKNVFQNACITGHFDIRTWAIVSQQHDAQIILSQLLSRLKKSTSGNVYELGEQLYQILWARRYLIVLDDIWSVEALDKVWRFFPDNGNGSQVLLTTRMSKVPKDCGSSVINMNLLDEDASWKLFCEKVFIQHGDLPPQLEEIGKEIVRLCKGLALSIVIIGGILLKAPRSVEHWEDVVRDIKSILNSKEEQGILDVLSLSYNHLPPRLKPCFLYMGVFEEDSQIRVSNIVKLWVGEGFIKPDGGRVLEEIAEGYLNELIDRNLIISCLLRRNGKLGSFVIHDLLRDLCLKVAHQQEFYHVISRGMMKGIERRLVCTSYLSHMRRPLARSIVTLPNCGYESILECRLLRVLHLFQPHDSPKELYEDVNLRYLTYTHPNDTKPLWKLPSSVSLIWNLQTLIIKDFFSISPIVVAPDKIWKMRQLRHVKCYKIYLPDPPPSDDHEQDDLLIMDSLQTLKVVVNLRLSEEVCRIIPNIKKLHLLYDSDMRRYDEGLIECLCNLEVLHELESLNLTTHWQTGNHDMFKKLTLPSSLNKLSLSGCGLHWDDLTIIGSLPQLQVLKLGKDSVTREDRWSPNQGQFQHLKFLKIKECYLCNWNAENSHFPVLEELFLSNLIELDEIPMNMGEIATLKLIRVDNCSESVAVSALKIKDQPENPENENLQIKIKIHDIYLKSLKERLEKEELTIHNFQLEC